MTPSGPSKRMERATYEMIRPSNGIGEAAVDVEHPSCRLFLAESTIPNAGLGIFTGIDLRDGDAIAEPDIIVPLHDAHYHATRGGIDDDLLWFNYAWQPSEMGMHFDMQGGEALVLGTGCVPNCNFALLNAVEEHQPIYDHAGLHRSRDVGTTGFTGFHGQRMLATRDIPAGGEIFVTYGENWFENRPEMSSVPFGENYHNVDVFLARFKYLALKYGGGSTTGGRNDNRQADGDFSRDLWEVVTAHGWFGTRNANALPLTFEDASLAQSIGSAMSRLPYSVRTPEWLASHGQCMDNIRPGNSTITQAGRGAFASRPIPEGGLVAPGPLLHIANRAALYLYDDDDDDDGHAMPSGAQLILNYCFGHGRSTVILCPYTSPSAYINHGSGPLTNVRVRWSDPSTTPHHNAFWLEEDVDFLRKTNAVGLSIDFVATRDIRPGEEVFLDYGPEWEAAWDEYVRQWEPPPGSKGYVPASMLKEPLRTLEEQSSEPYPDNVIFYCHYDYHPGDVEGSFEWEDDWMELRLGPCQIISRGAPSMEEDAEEDEVVYVYTTIMLTMDQVDTDMILTFMLPLPRPGEVHILTDVPRWAIEVRDKPYAKDEFAPRAFRHEMMMPDDMFPEAWKNVA
ncbi:hypothetical protein ACHAW5_000731 [Stephanodiscus triporus]|uniref:SET domain-containing protein n=1 Tax=Stephanodiscus triporus TaxID=2934178 RepID=A0ABD3P4W4_9STRA